MWNQVILLIQVLADNEEVWSEMERLVQANVKSSWIFAAQSIINSQSKRD